MGDTLSKVLSNPFAAKKMKLTMLGLPNSGKSSILRQLDKSNKFVQQNSIWTYFEYIEYGDFEICWWDLSYTKDRTPSYLLYKDTKAIIFVIDSQDKEKLLEVKQDIEHFLQFEHIH